MSSLATLSHPPATSPPPITTAVPQPSSHSLNHSPAQHTPNAPPHGPHAPQPMLPHAPHAPPLHPPHEPPFPHNITISHPPSPILMQPISQTHLFLEEITHLLAIQAQNQHKLLAEQTQQQHLLFHLLSKLPTTPHTP